MAELLEGASHGARGKRWVKSALGWLLFVSGAYRLLWKKKAAIVLFHRVDDRYPDDPITCSREEFVRYCDFFRQYFTVVSLAELLDKLSAGRDISQHLAITFDDGYRDNCYVAAVELERRGLPASFFVTTDFIGGTENVWWDTMRAVRSEWMSWDDVRSLHDRRFELGPHTRTHVDLGGTHGAVAAEEIRGSKQRLDAELGTESRSFAYPFGGEHQMSEENRETVRRAGFRCCLSAYHGTVGPLSDPLYLCRIPISPWFISPYQFGFEAGIMNCGGRPAAPTGQPQITSRAGVT